MKDAIRGVQRFAYRQTLDTVQPIPQCVQPFPTKTLADLVDQLVFLASRSRIGKAAHQ
jgi:hypothetical protein